MDRQQVFELIRDRLADILEIDPPDDHRGRIPSPTTSRPTPWP